VTTHLMTVPAEADAPPAPSASSPSLSHWTRQIQPDAETPGAERHDLQLIEATPRPQVVHVGLEFRGSDDDLPTFHARLTARPHLTLILGGVDCGFVHSL
jgi:hypothetical protein